MKPRSQRRCTPGRRVRRSRECAPPCRSLLAAGLELASLEESGSARAAPSASRPGRERRGVRPHHAAPAHTRHHRRAPAHRLSRLCPIVRRTIAALTIPGVSRDAVIPAICLRFLSSPSSPPGRFAAVPIPKPPSIDARAYVLLDYQSGRVLAADKADVQSEPASITKLMTAYGVFRALKEKRLTLDRQRHHQRACLARRRLAHVRAGGHADSGRNAHQGHDHPVRQRRDHRARREDRRHRRRLRADDEQLREASSAQEHAFRQQLGRACRPDALHDARTTSRCCRAC